MPQNPLKIGWAEFAVEPDATVAISAQLWITAEDGTVSFAGIPPTSAHRQAFLYLDNTSDFVTTLALVSLHGTGGQDLALNFRAAHDPSVACGASAKLPPFGQAVLNAVELLPCSVGSLGLLSIQGEHNFTGIAFVASTVHDGVFTRQFVEPAQPDYTALPYWTVRWNNTLGQVRFGQFPTTGCLSIADRPIEGALHTVHSSHWQMRADAASPWADVPDSARTGQVCGYTPTAPGQYRGVAEISVDGTRGMYATSNVLTVAAQDPPGDGSGTQFSVGDTVSGMPSGFWFPSLIETGKGASFVSSGGTVTLAWTSSAGVIQYNTFRWTCASSGGCEVVNGRVTKGTIVQSATAGDSESPVGGGTNSGSVDEFALASVNGAAQGVAFANGSFLVVDWADDVVYSYTSTGRRNAGADFGLGADLDVGGITHANGRLYILADSGSNVDTGGNVYAYTFTGTRDPAADFALATDNGSPQGITHANGRFYVLDHFDTKVYAYTTSGSRDASADFDLGDGNDWPTGIVYADGAFYVVDSNDDKVYGYTSAGTRDAAADLDLNAANRSAGGVTYSNGRLYVVDNGSERVYSYPITGGDGTDASPSFPAGRGLSNQMYTVGMAIPALTLPRASGGDGTLTYSLAPSVPGLTFSPAARTLSGTPSSAGSYAMTYAATDADGDTDILSFTVSVAAASPSGDGAESGSDGRFNVGDTIPDMPSGFWFPSLIETGNGASFVASGGTVTLAWNSSGGVIQYNTFRWTCASSGGCEVVNGRVTKGTVVQSETGG